MSLPPVAEILVKQAEPRLRKSNKGVHLMIESGRLTARLVTEAPRPYYLIAIDEKFLAEEKAAQEKESDQAAT